MTEKREKPFPQGELLNEEQLEQAAGGGGWFECEQRYNEWVCTGAGLNQCSHFKSSPGSGVIKYFCDIFGWSFEESNCGKDIKQKA